MSYCNRYRKSNSAVLILAAFLLVPYWSGRRRHRFAAGRKRHCLIDVKDLRRRAGYGEEIQHGASGSLAQEEAAVEPAVRFAIRNRFDAASLRHRARASYRQVARASGKRVGACWAGKAQPVAGVVVGQANE